ncbi:4a-hydroxytetrahydrobiopterin dehydratase [Gammaproteobacteria bacterium]|nr:4a-hydroxytetrahydrobiopterin dehydratase [Gammaproteobacteria bacterium]
MSDLLTQSCEACRIDAPKVIEQDIEALMLQISKWELICEPIDQLKRVFSFSDYESSVNFSNEVAKMADQEDHHPQIILEWGKVSVLWWSHKIQGLHQNDFICAAKTDSLYLEN